MTGVPGGSSVGTLFTDSVIMAVKVVTECVGALFE